MTERELQSKFTVAELKAQLKARGLSAVGFEGVGGTSFRRGQDATRIATILDEALLLHETQSQRVPHCVPSPQAKFLGPRWILR